MNVAYINSPGLSFFSDAKEQLGQMITQLESADHAHHEHGEVEQYKNLSGLACSPAHACFMAGNK